MLPFIVCSTNYLEISLSLHKIRAHKEALQLKKFKNCSVLGVDRIILSNLSACLMRSDLISYVTVERN